MRMAPPLATKGRGGYGKGNGFGQADSSNNGYRNKPAAYPQAGAGFGGGYTKGVKAAKPGYGGKPFVPSGQAAKPNGAGGPNAQGAKPAGYGGATGAKAGYSRFPNNGGFKGPKPGYGGLPTGYGQRLNGYGGYPNGGAKAPKPGYGGVGNGEASNGQGAKSNGFGGYPNGGAKAPKPGYGDGVGNGEANNGQGAKSNGYGVPGGVPKIQTGLKGKSLNHEVPSLSPVTGFIKGVIKPVEPEPTVGVPALPLTKGMPSLVTSWKTPKPQDPVVSQSSPSKPIPPEQTPVIPQDNTPNPVPSEPQGQTPAPLLPQANGTNPPARPSPEIPQDSSQKPVAPILFPQENDLKPTTEVQQSVSPASPQGNDPKPEVLHPTTPQGDSPKPTAAPVLPSVLPQTKDTKPVAPVPEIPQMKDPKPVAPEPDVPQTTVPSLAIEPTPAMPQMKGQKLPNPDCGHGVSGQWTKLPSAGYGSGPWYPNSEGAKASKPGQGYGPKPQQPDYVNPGAGFGFAGLGGMTKGKSGGPGQLPYSGAPIIPARLDGASPVEPQTAELGPEVKSGHAYGGPYGAQPMGMGAEGMPQVRYGIGGLLFGGSPTGYGSNPYGKYGNAYAAQTFGSKAAGNYNPFGFNADPKSAPKYRMEGSPYAASASDAKASGKYGPYGGQQFGVPVNYGKYGHPSLPFEALGPVTDGQSVDQPALPYEVPVIDGVKSVDQFGDGEVPHQPIAPLVDGVGEGPVSHIKGGVQAEAVPTGSPFTGSAASLGNSAHPPVDTPSEAVTPQHLLIQQNLKGPQLHQANSWTGDEEPKHNLKGFFGNGYHG
ncbi:calymmin [Clarias gariepinus]|uniref:calymmin n=1 Tax=Clarias gariepinus TaxID=13013 RepID=UPI00234C10A1|nr:calymmin [Clarias gariepinus]